MTLFFLLVALLGIGTWILRYPDIVTTTLTLTSVDAPRMVVVRTEGKLAELIVKDGQQVHRGQYVAYSESVADHEQVLGLEKNIQQILHRLSSNDWDYVKRLNMRSFNQLGEVQNDFHTFSLKLTDLSAFLVDGLFLEKKKLLVKDQGDLQTMEANIADQLALQQADVDLAREEFFIQEKLYKNQALSLIEYKREKSKLLMREMPLKGLSSTLIQNRSAQVAKHKELLELENTIRERKINFLQSVQALLSSIQSWKSKYVLHAPIAGTVSFSAPWQEQQHLAAGEVLMTVEPVTSSYSGVLKIGQSNVGRLRVGQKVLVKLDGFPYREYGLIEGKLSQISNTPGKDSTYWGYVELPNNLQTKYGHKLPYRNGLKGQAEIITADRRLAERLIASIVDGGE